MDFFWSENRARHSAASLSRCSVALFSSSPDFLSASDLASFLSGLSLPSAEATLSSLDSASFDAEVCSAFESFSLAAGATLPVTVIGAVVGQLSLVKTLAVPFFPLRVCRATSPSDCATATLPSSKPPNTTTKVGSFEQRQNIGFMTRPFPGERTAPPFVLRLIRSVFVGECSALFVAAAAVLRTLQAWPRSFTPQLRGCPDCIFTGN